VTRKPMFLLTRETRIAYQLHILFLQLLFLVLSGAASASTSSGWLVLRDGQILETRGAWGRYRPDGRFLIYLAPGDTKPSLIEEWKVDIERSAEATTSGRPPAPRKRAKLVIDDSKVGNFSPEYAEALSQFDAAMERGSQASVDRAFQRLLRVRWLGAAPRRRGPLRRDVPLRLEGTERLPTGKAHGSGTATRAPRDRAGSLSRRV
jgi:hypothetical protein